MKRFFVILGAALVTLLVLLLVGNGIVALRVDSQIKSRIAKLRTAGEPASIVEVTPVAVPDADNAAAKLAALAPQLQAFDRDLAAFENTPLGKSYRKTQERDEPISAVQLAAVRKVVDAHPQVATGLAEAATCPRYASRLDYRLPHDRFLQQVLNGAGEFRNVARYIDLQMFVLAADGRRDDAVQRGIELLRLTRHYGDEPLIVNYLTAVAIRGVAIESLYDALAAGSLADETHALLDQELAQHDSFEPYVKALRTDRALAMDMLDTPSTASERALLWYAGWPVRRGYAGYLDFFDQLLTALAASTDDAAKRMQILDALGNVANLGWMAQSVDSSLRASTEAHWRTLATVRALRVYNALCRYRAENGREATGLDDLDLPAAAAIDPYCGQPLRLKLTPDGWMVYSVMENGVDDGGDFGGMLDYGVAPAGKWRTTDAKSPPTEGGP